MRRGAGWLLQMIDGAGNAGSLCAVRAAEERRTGFDAVADDAAAAVIADRRELVDRALEAVEHVPLPGRDHFERQVVVVAADFTLSHGVFASLLPRFVE